MTGPSDPISYIAPYSACNCSDNYFSRKHLTYLDHNVLRSWVTFDYDLENGINIEQSHLRIGITNIFHLIVLHGRQKYK